MSEKSYDSIYGTMAATSLGNDLFPKTRWTMILAAGKPSDPECRQALATLCEGYWYPVYAFIRRKGHDADAAQDLTQGFFGSLEKDKNLAEVVEGRRRSRGRS